MTIDPVELRSFIDALKTHRPESSLATREHDADGALRIVAALQRIPRATEALDVAFDGAQNANELAIARTIATIDSGIDKIKNDDLTGVETMLAGQAAALEVIFNEYVKRGARTNFHAAIHMCLGFALRAQAQCRTTVQSLAQLKERRLARRSSPPVEADPKPAE